MKPESFYELAKLVGELDEQTRRGREKLAAAINEDAKWPDDLSNAARLLLVSYAGRQHDWDSGMHTASLETHVRQVASGAGDIPKKMAKWVKTGLNLSSE